MSVGSGLTPDVTGGGLYLASEPADSAPEPEKEFPLPHTPRAAPDLLECLNSTSGMSGSPPTPPSASAAAPVAVLSAAVLWPPARSNCRWVLRNMGTPRSTPSSVFEPPRTLLLP
ncbi:MAG TPA: hypothetical protein VIL46_16980 [Gemmataceae bacterium]